MTELNVDVAVNSNLVTIEIRPKPEAYNYFSVPTETKEQVDAAPQVAEPEKYLPKKRKYTKRKR